MTPDFENITIVAQPITREQLSQWPSGRLGDLIKAVVDVDKKIMALGGELHADAERALLEQGSKQKFLWGINLYPDISSDEWIEFDSMINLRPSQGNRSRGVDDPVLRGQIRNIVARLIAS